jgi:hypothetical protein
VRVIYDEGREQFEALRGEPCEHAYQWKPRRLRTPAPSLDRRR